MAKQLLDVEIYYDGSWHAVAAYTRNPVTMTRLRQAGSEPAPFTATVTLQGIYNPKNPLSPLYGKAGQNTPIRMSLPSPSGTRFYGEVSSWEPDRTLNYEAGAGKGDAWTTLTASGILRRSGAGSAPLRSAMFRSMSGVTDGDFVPLAYWSMEDAEGATRFGAYTPNTEAALFTGAVEPAAYSGSAGSDPVPVIRTGGVISGRFPSTTLVATGGGDTIAQVQFMATVPSTLSGDATFLEVDVPSTGGNNVVMLRVVWQNSSTSMQLRYFNDASTVVGFAELDFTGQSQLRDVPLLFSFSLYTDVAGSPGSIRTSFNAWNDGNGFPALFDLDSWTAPAVPVPTAWRALGSAANTGWALGHLGLFTDPAVLMGASVSDNAGALDGYAGEQAHQRVTRLAREHGIPITIEGSTSQVMGAQPQETLVNLLAEAERTDDGLLFEPRDGYGLIYRTGRERYNRPVALALDYAANEVAPPLRPVLDDLASRNDVTAARRNGGSARAVLETGPLSVQAPPDGIGQYDTRVDVNTVDDDPLPHHARWHLHKGTINEVRYASVTVDLDASPGLAEDASAVDIGDVITIANLPAEDGVDLARLTVLGYTETIGSHRRTITFSCIPASTFDVGVRGPDAMASRRGAKTTVLAEDLTDVETSADVDTGSDRWITSASHPTRFPAGGGPGVNVDINGVTYLCTAITGVHPSLTLTLVRVSPDRTHSTGDAVTVTDTGRRGL